MPDDAVDIKFSADAHAAQTALEQIAASLQKIGEKGKDAGREHKEGMEWAAAGTEEFTSKIEGAISAGALFDKAIESLTGRMELYKKRMDEAAEAQTRGAQGQHAWLDQLRPGDDPAAVNQRLDQITMRTGATRAAADQTLAAVIQANAPWGGAPIEREVEQAQAALETTPIGATAAQRAAQIARLQHFRPEFTAQGAGDALGRTDWSGKPQRMVEAMVGAGIRGNYQTLGGFAEALSAVPGEEVDPQSLLKTVETLIRTAETQGHTAHGDLGAALDWYRNTDEGQRAAKRMDWTEITGGKAGAAGGHNAGLAAAMPQILAPGFQMASPAANDPQTRDARQSLKEASDRLLEQRAETTENESGQSLENFKRQNLEGIKAQALKVYNDTVDQVGDWEDSIGGWLDRPRDVPWSRVSPEQQIQWSLGQLQGFGLEAGRTAQGERARGEPVDRQTQATLDLVAQQIHVLNEMATQLREIRRQGEKPQQIIIRHDGDEHRAASVPAPAAGH
jgi:hypothetical protein